MGHILVNITTLSLLFFVCRLEAVKHKKFCVQNPNNTLCIYPEDGPGELCSNYKERKLTNSEKRDIIQWHANNSRDGGYNNQDVKLRGGVYWDEGLAAIARKWASQCRLSKDTNRHFGNKSVEQNVFRVREIENGSYTVADVLNQSEKNGRSYGGALKEWKIVLMGCGGSTFSPGKSNVTCIVLVCNYVNGDGSELLTRRNGAVKRVRRLYVEGKGKGTKKEEEEDDDEEDDDDDDDYDEYEDPFSVEEMKKEVEKKIDEEFGPFGRFLEPTERWIIPSSNLRQPGEIREFKANKDYSPFEDAGASLRSKGKYVLWSMRDDGVCLRPKFYTALSSWGAIVIYQLLIGL